MMLTCLYEHMEKKNNSDIRTFVGYDRHDSQGEESLLNRLCPALDFMQSLLRRSPNRRTRRS